MSVDLAPRGTLRVQTITIGKYVLRVGTSEGRPGTLPLLLFNGLGANLELVRGFAAELAAYGIGIVIFDVPGAGESSAPKIPYRLRHLAKTAAKVLDALGIAGQVDVAGVSWGGALAQEFAHRQSKRTRRLVLAATTAGAFALPGKLSVLAKMVDPQRYKDRNYMTSIGGELYGGKFRDNPELLKSYGKLLRPPKGVGYYFQLLAAAGWTSVYWLPFLRAPTLVMMGTDDPIVPPFNGRILAALIPNARLVLLPEGHLFLVTSAHESAGIINEFLTADVKALAKLAFPHVGPDMPAVPAEH